MSKLDEAKEAMLSGVLLQSDLAGVFATAYNSLVAAEYTSWQMEWQKGPQQLPLEQQQAQPE